MAGPIRISILANARQANRELDQSEGRFARFGRGVGKVLAGAAVAAGAGVAALGAMSVKSASDAQQSLGATQTVFGKYADTVIKRSNEAAQAVGLSANEYRELSNVMGASLAGVGMPLEKVTGLTDQLNKRAADMSATFGGTAKEAVEAIGSLMRGEADPIERYGVSIKQADVSARLAAQGLDGLTGEAKKTAEMQARLDLLMEKTAITQGAFARESNTLAGQQQRLGATWENLKAKAGTALLPALTGLTAGAVGLLDKVSALGPTVRAVAGDLGDRLAPVAARAADAFRSKVLPILPQVRDKAVEFGGAIADLAGKVGPALAAVATALRPLAGLVAGIAIGALAAGFKAATSAMKPVGDAFKRIGDLARTYPTVFGAVGAAVVGVVAALTAWRIVVGTVIAITKVWAAVQGVLNAVMSANPLGLVVLAIVALVAAFTYAWKNSETFRDIVTGTWTAVQEKATAIFGAIRDFIGGVFQAISSIISTILGVIRSVISFYLNGFRVVWGTIFGAIKAAVEFYMLGIRMYISTVIGVIVGIFNGARSIITTMVNIFNSVKNGAVEKLSGLVTWVTGLPGRITGAVGDLGTLLLETGKDVVRGLINGLESMAGSLAEKARSLGGSIVSGIGNVLQINSPSRVMRRKGRGVGEGLVLGILDEASRVGRAAATLGRAAIPDLPDLRDRAGAMARRAQSWVTALSAKRSEEQTTVIYLTSTEVDQLSRGRRIRADLRAYYDAGGQPA